MGRDLQILLKVIQVILMLVISRLLIPIQKKLEKQRCDSLLRIESLLSTKEIVEKVVCIDQIRHTATRGQEILINDTITIDRISYKQCMGVMQPNERNINFALAEIDLDSIQHDRDAGEITPISGHSEHVSTRSIFEPAATDWECRKHTQAASWRIGKSFNYFRCIGATMSL